MRSASRHRRALQAEGCSCPAVPGQLHSDDGPPDVSNAPEYHHDASFPGTTLHRPAAAHHALAATSERQSSGSPLCGKQQTGRCAAVRQHNIFHRRIPQLQRWAGGPCWHACHASSMHSISIKGPDSIAGAACQLSSSHQQQRSHQTDSRQAQVAEANAVMQVYPYVWTSMIWNGRLQQSCA